jgi:hypothetical protein
MSKQFKVNIINWSGQQLALNLNDTSSFLRRDGTWATPAGGPASSAGVTGLQAAGFSPPFTGLVQITGTNGIGVGQSNNIITISGVGLNYIYNTGISSGVNTQFIPFPVTLGSNPTVIASLRHDAIDTIVPVQISGAVSSGFWANFGNTIGTTGYILNVHASTTTLTGSIASITTNNVTNNVTNITTGSQVSVTGGPFITAPNLTGLGAIIVSQTGSTIYFQDSNLIGNMGTGLGIWSGNVGQVSDFYSLSASTGIQISQGAGSPITFSTSLGTQYVTGLNSNVKFTGSGFYFDLLSGTVGPGTYLALFNTMFATPSNANVRVVVKYWNGTNTTGIWGMTEGFSSAYTTGFVGGPIGGATTSGFIESDFNSIITLPAASNIVGISAAVSATGVFALSGLLDYTTGAPIRSATSIQLLKLF